MLRWLYWSPFWHSLGRRAAVIHQGAIPPAMATPRGRTLRPGPAAARRSQSRPIRRVHRTRRARLMRLPLPTRPRTPRRGPRQPRRRSLRPPAIPSATLTGRSNGRLKLRATSERRIRVRPPARPAVPALDSRWTIGRRSPAADQTRRATCSGSRRVRTGPRARRGARRSRRSLIVMFTERATGTPPAQGHGGIH